MRVPALLVLVALAPAPARAQPGGTAGSTLGLSTVLSQQDGATERTSVTQLLRYAGRHGRLSYGLCAGWSRLRESSGSANASWTALSNLAGGVGYDFDVHRRLRGGVGIEGFIRIDPRAPSVHQRTSDNTRLYATAVDGWWNAWLWSPDAVGIVLPANASAQHQLAGLAAAAFVEGALALGIPNSDVTQPSLGLFLQTRIGYQLLLRQWLLVRGALQAAVLPGAQLFTAQSAARLLLALTRGRWAIGTEAVLNLDEPYGRGPRGQQISALHLELGVAL